MGALQPANAVNILNNPPWRIHHLEFSTAKLTVYLKAAKTFQKCIESADRSVDFDAASEIETKMANSTPNCADLASPSYTNFGVSIFILLGILVSYLPQHHRIISRRTSEGISPYFVLLGTTGGTCAFANILTLPTSRADLACCSEISRFECFAGLLGIFQVGVQWSCFAVILLLFLLFFPHATPFTPPKPSSTSSPPSYRTAVFIALTCVLHAVVTLIVSAMIIYLAPQHLQSWANALGILATLLAAVQFIPQLFTTWRLQAAGSLSIPTMCIQTPGSFVWAASLAERLGPAGWSLWGIYMVTGCLQGGVLGMCVYFELRERRRRRRKESADGDGSGEEGEREQNGGIQEEADEDTALLGNER